MRILVVDDEEHLRRMMRFTLEAAGYEVEDAADGEAGLALFGDGTRFDASLLDQRMPGMDGLEVLRRMKLQRSDAVVIMVTAYATIELAVDAMKLGATDFVRKPMTPETLRHAVAAALAKRERAAALPIPEGQSTPAPTMSGTAVQLPPIEIWTTNGFFVGRVPRDPATPDQSTPDYHFIVRRGKGESGSEVTVSIEPTVLARVARESRRTLSPTGAFWRRQAESALVNHLWSEAALPDEGRLVISRPTGAMVNDAMSWSGD
jgi:DNA-binding response OmpR family regulator